MKDINALALGLILSVTCPGALAEPSDGYLHFSCTADSKSSEDLPYQTRILKIRTSDPALMSKTNTLEIAIGGPEMSFVSAYTQDYSFKSTQATKGYWGFKPAGVLTTGFPTAVYAKPVFWGDKPFKTGRIILATKAGLKRYRCSAEAVGPVDPGVALKVSELSSDSKIGSQISDIAELLKDNNITSGTTSFSAVQTNVKGAAATQKVLENLGEDFYSSEVKGSDDAAYFAKTVWTTKVFGATEEFVDSLGAMIEEGNAGTGDAENNVVSAGNAWAVLAGLAKRPAELNADESGYRVSAESRKAIVAYLKNIMVVHKSGRVNRPEEDGGPRNVNFVTFLDTTNGIAVRFLEIEGTM